LTVRLPNERLVSDWDNALALEGSHCGENHGRILVARYNTITQSTDYFRDACSVPGRNETRQNTHARPPCRVELPRLRTFDLIPEWAFSCKAFETI
jgi:hypothetical protein